MCSHDPETLLKGARLQDGDHHSQQHRVWSRRQFMQGLGMSVTGAAMTLAGTPIRSFGASSLLSALHASGTDRILVIVQLSGGNDGLNTVVPYTNDTYFQSRPDIAINASSVLPLTSDLGLHPSLSAFADLYHDGNMEIVQGVGYANPVLSHFAGTDAWATASHPFDLSTSGWLGRYLESENPDFFDSPPDSPLGIQLGNGSPLLFQGSVAGMGVTFPDLDLLNQFFATGIFYDESFAPPTVFGGELSFVRSIANNAVRYADSISTAEASGTNLVEYPLATGLTGNLATTARLIRGGLSTNVYHLNIGGFDTHSSQSARHGSLMQELSDSLGSFLADLQVDGLDERVLVMTFSEFGRRVAQNGSAGTDHGTAAPLFLFGGGLAGGLIGDKPSLTDVDAGGNLKYGIDFRSVYASVLTDWFGLSDLDVFSLLGADFGHLPLIDSSFVTSLDFDTIPEAVTLFSNYPNPFSTQTTLEFELPRSEYVSLELFDVQGRSIQTLIESILPAGRHQVTVQAGSLSSGTYMARIRTKGGVKTRKLVLAR